MEEDTEIEAHSEYIVIEEDIGEAEYLEEDEEEEEVELEIQKDEEEEGAEVEVEEQLKELLKTEDESYVNPQDVEYIYAEGVSENNEIIIGEVPRFTCKHCGVSFKRLDSLYKHNSVHKGKTVCPVCNAVFSRVAHRTRHMKLKHPDVEIVKTNKRGPRGKRGQEIRMEDQSDPLQLLSNI